MKKLIVVAYVASMPFFTFAQGSSSLEDLKRELNAMRERMRAMEEQIQRLETNAPAIVNSPKATNLIDAPSATQKSASSPGSALAQPKTLMEGNRAYLNLSFDGLFAAGSSSATDVEALEPGGHDPKQRGFTVQNLETTFEGAVDPYFRALSAIVFQVDPEGESVLEVEEAYAETTSLPGNLPTASGTVFYGIRQA